ncbi:MAG: TRAP transporter large permease subunit [Lachnospiraceae bacterium]|nr:TRAP transporter large permease subunit [Lachnospiraceae bacterium]
MVTALIIFLVTYILMMIFQKYRPWIALASAAVFLISGMLPWGEALSYVDFNVLLMIAGTMGTVSLVIESKMPALLADIILSKVSNVKWAIIVLSLFAGLVSAFIDNVATVLMIAPIALAMAKKLKINPVGMIIAIAVSSNLQGAATLVGDTTSILLGGYAGMSFLDFFWYKGRPGIFWAVELGAVCAASLLLIIFKNETQKVESRERTKVTDYFPSFLMVATVLLLILASFLPNKPAITNGLICMGLFLIGAVYSVIRNKSWRIVKKALAEIDFDTILLLFGLFIVIGGITDQGVVDAIAEVFDRIGGGNLFWIYTLITWVSVLFSAFIDNIPYVTTMLPVVRGMALAMGVDPTILYFGLLSGATLGGNLTPIGASANITGIGILRKEGYEVKNSDFLKIGVPFTLAAVIPAYIFFWVFYA